MTDRPELTPELLADLDAEDPLLARQRAADDPRAQEVLAALTATRNQLSALPDPPLPAEYAARWTTALSTEPAPALPTSPSDERRVRRIGSDERAVRHDRGWGRRRVWVGLAAAGFGIAVLLGGAFVGPPEPIVDDQPGPVALDGIDLAAAGVAMQGKLDAGAFADPVRRSACLAAVAPQGVPADAALLGGRDVVLGGRPGVLLLLAAGAGEPAGMHVVVVDPDCGPAGGTLLGADSVGR